VQTAEHVIAVLTFVRLSVHHPSYSSCFGAPRMIVMAKLFSIYNTWYTRCCSDPSFKSL